MALNAAPGARMEYVSIDTHVLGMVIRGATGRGCTALLHEKIIAPLGMEHAPYYVTDGNGVAFLFVTEGGPEVIGRVAVGALFDL